MLGLKVLERKQIYVNKRLRRRAVRKSAPNYRGDNSGPSFFFAGPIKTIFRAYNAFASIVDILLRDQSPIAISGKTPKQQAWDLTSSTRAFNRRARTRHTSSRQRADGTWPRLQLLYLRTGWVALPVFITYLMQTFSYVWSWSKKDTEYVAKGGIFSPHLPLVQPCCYQRRPFFPSTPIVSYGVKGLGVIRLDFLTKNPGHAATHTERENESERERTKKAFSHDLSSSHRSSETSVVYNNYLILPNTH